MNNQTARRPDNKRPTRSAQQAKGYSKQTAHVQAVRDGQPLIFGWGGHLSRAQKTQIQRLAVWSFIGFIVLVCVIVFAAFWTNFNVVIPNLAVANVNGQTISQDTYRKMVALDGQISANKFKGKTGLRSQEAAMKTKQTNAQKAVTDDKTAITKLNAQIKALPANSSQLAALEKQLTTATAKQTQDNKDVTNYTNLYTSLSNQESLQEELFTQSQVANDSVEWLQEDILIRNWLKTQSPAIQNQINPTSSAVTNALNSFKANLPTGTTYNSFLQTSSVSDGDMQSAMTVINRRNNMQTYEASLINTPARQVEARAITLATAADAQKYLKQIKAGANFATIAKAQSVDSNTKTKGGELGWLANGQYMLNDGSNIGSTIDDWIMAPARTPNEFSPVLSENGTYHIVQIEKIDPARAVDTTTLNALKQNALKYWVAEQKAQGAKVSEPDSTILLNTTNMPSWLPASAPSTATAVATG
jgi:parvulin-like peptidyl-prolyl isomerase